MESITIPPLMQGLARDHRGLPVPFIVLIDNTGKPRFQINDTKKVDTCLKHNLCAICGQPMKSHDRWLVGGPLSAFMPNGAYIDTPTHYACLHYALNQCPYLAGKTTKRLDPQRLENDPGLDDIQAIVDPTQMETPVPFFVAVRISGFSVKRPEPHVRHLIPERPFLYIECWRRGRKLDQKEITPLWEEYIKSLQ